MVDWRVLKHLEELADVLGTEARRLRRSGDYQIAYMVGQAHSNMLRACYAAQRGVETSIPGQLSLVEPAVGQQHDRDPTG